MITLEQLRALANEAGHEISGEVHKFINWIENKRDEKTVGQLQAEQAAAAGSAPEAAPSVAAPAAPPPEPPAPEAVAEQPTA